MSEEIVPAEEINAVEEVLAPEVGGESEVSEVSEEIVSPKEIAGDEAVETPEITKEAVTPEEKPVATPVPAPILVSSSPKPKQEKKIAVPVAVTLEEIETKLEKEENSVVVGSGEKDEVKLSAVVYKNFAATRSVSVFHVQRRLYELGYQDSASDRRGFFGDNTKNALAYFQSANGLSGEGFPNAETLTLLFTGDENVSLNLD